jgi:hypothetical protein
LAGRVQDEREVGAEQAVPGWLACGQLLGMCDVRTPCMR